MKFMSTLFKPADPATLRTLRTLRTWQFPPSL
jgi:hypothetical protein